MQNTMVSLRKHSEAQIIAAYDVEMNNWDRESQLRRTYGNVELRWYYSTTLLTGTPLVVTHRFDSESE